MNITTWLQVRYPQLFTESKESVVLDHCLCNVFSEKRKKVETILPRMSEDFDKRLLNLLENEKIENVESSYSVVRSLFDNRKLQYSFSAVMVLTLTFVMVGKVNKSETRINESAGVILENSSYLNEPTSIDLSENYQKKILVDHIKNDPASIYGLKELELYYQKTGRGSAAEEVHYLINAAEN
jgi:hypothetical protein